MTPTDLSITSIFVGVGMSLVQVIVSEVLAISETFGETSVSFG